MNTDRLPPAAAVLGGLAFGIARLAGARGGPDAADAAWAVGAVAAGVAFAGLLTALARPAARGEAGARTSAAGAGDADPLPALLSAFQAYVDLELWDLAFERGQEIARRFADRPESDAVRRKLSEIQWKLETRPGAAAAGRPAAPPIRPLADMFAAVKTYVDLEAWPLALEKAQEIIRHHPESDEAQKLSRNIEVLKGKAAAARRRPAGVN